MPITLARRRPRPSRWGSGPTSRSRGERIQRRALRGSPRTGSTPISQLDRDALALARTIDARVEPQRGRDANQIAEHDFGSTSPSFLHEQNPADDDLGLRLHDGRAHRSNLCAPGGRSTRSINSTAVRRSRRPRTRWLSVEPPQHPTSDGRPSANAQHSRRTRHDLQTSTHSGSIVRTLGTNSSRGYSLQSASAIHPGLANRLSNDGELPTMSATSWGSTSGCSSATT
jgi:hypothetical protein